MNPLQKDCTKMTWKESMFSNATTLNVFKTKQKMYELDYKFK